MQALKIFQRLSLVSTRKLPPTARTFTTKSDLSLDKIYPKSSLKITTPEPPKPTSKFNGYIPMNEVEITYSRSSGPGGQNVNTVNTKVDLRVKVESASFLSDEVKKRILQDYYQKINKEGYLVIKSELTRYQQLNVADALEKLRNLIREAEKPKEKILTPETQFLLQKRREKAARERLYIKRHRSQVKADRQAPVVNL